MRTKRSGIGGHGLGVAIVALLAAGLAPATASARDSRDIRIEDRCDPVTFNAAEVPGGCFGDGNVTLDELVASADPHVGGHHGWRFSREETDLKRDQALVVDNEGGEVHTFTEVAAFGRGDVPFLNPAVPETARADVIEDHTLAQGVRLTFRWLDRGTHRFQCMIHPWMRSTVTVR